MLPRIEEALQRIVTPEVTPEVAQLLLILDGEMGSTEMMRAMALKDEKHFRQHYRQAALDAGLIEMTRPAAPRSSKQRYRLTANGQAWKERHQGRKA